MFHATMGFRKLDLPNALKGRALTMRIGLASGLMMLASAATSASAFGANIIGPVSVDGVVCVADLTFGNSMYVPVPRIWASNRRAGLGNDPQTVKYWTRAANLADTPLTPWQFAGQGTANDNSFASLPYYWRFGSIYSNARYSITSNFRAHFRVEWWEGSSFLGGQDYYFPVYLLYSNGWLPGTYRAC